MTNYYNMYKMIMKDLPKNQTYPRGDHRSNKLPLSLQFVIFANYYFTINAWSVFLYMFINFIILQLDIGFIYILIMLIPSFILGTLSVIISRNLLRKSNILLSIIQVIMNILGIDMLNSGPLSSLLKAELNFGSLYWYVISLLLVSLILSSGSTFMLIFNRSLQSYYLNKDLYRKPWFIMNFAGTSIIASIPLILVYFIYFNLLV